MADVTKNTGAGRYEVHVDGELAGWLDYADAGDGVTALPHTIVEPRFGGRGLAGELVRTALDEIRAQGRRVDPQCPYVKAWIARHPDHADLVAPGLGDSAAQA